MPPVITIKKFPEYSEATDYAGLVRDYLDACQRYSGKVWTDYNVHDPGVTSLELICLAITELGLKSETDIFRIIFNSFKMDFDADDYALYGPLQVFPCTPLTYEDYRKLLVDKFIDVVDNIWIQPNIFTKEGASYKGLLNVLVKPKPGVEKDALSERIYNYFKSIKNIGEDIYKVIILNPVKITINLVASIKGNILPEEVQARLRMLIFNEVERPITFDSYLHALQNGEEINEVLSGPLLENGRIQDASIRNSDLDAQNKIYKSKILHLIAASEFIDRVISMDLFVNGVAIDSEGIELTETEFPSFDFYESGFELYKDDNLLYINKETQEYIYKSNYRTKKVFSKKSLVEYLLPNIKSNISLKEITEFYSIQNQFPKIYGISSYGQVQQTEKARLSRVRFKAYLAMFEQIMQNYLSQLANIDKLFSLKRYGDYTYFYDYPEGIPDFQEVTFDKKEQFIAKLGTIINKYDDRFPRRNMFIDHLCARFGEDLSGNLIAGEYIESTYDLNFKYLKEIKLKSTFLRNYVDLGMYRTKSRIGDSKDNTGLSSLQTRLFILLGIENFQKRIVTKFPDFKEEKTKNKLKVEIKSNEDLKSFFKDAVDLNNYSIEEKKNKYLLKFSMYNAREYKIVESTAYVECENTMEDIRNHSIALNEHCEYFYLVENILLRPEVESLATSDPYSNICSIVVPNWPYRFQSSYFKNNFKNLVLANAPIHIKIDLFFIDYSQMAHFEKLYYQIEEANEKRAFCENEKKALTEFLLSLNAY